MLLKCRSSAVSIAVGPVTDLFRKGSTATTSKLLGTKNSLPRTNLRTLSTWTKVCGSVHVPSQRCHADKKVQQFRRSHSLAFDRSLTSRPLPPLGVLDHLAALRAEPSSDEGSTAVEGAPLKGTGHLGRGPPVQVVVGFTSRELCDRQTLASLGRWRRSLPVRSIWMRSAS